MANIMFSWINRADAATLSGGSWQVTLPLANLQQVRLARPARSTDDALASTKFDIDLGTVPAPVRLLAVIRHNCTQDALFRVTGGASPGATTFDSGWGAMWPPIYGLLDREFEHPDWYSGRISAAEAALYPIRGIIDLGAHHLHRYWRVEINDTANPAGYVELARLWMGPVWQPTVNYDWGPALGWESRDLAAEARSGARFAERRTPRRVFRFSLHELSNQEAYGRLLDMCRLIGTEGELLVIPDLDDYATRHRRDIFGRVRSWGDGAVDAAFGKQLGSMTVEDLL